MNLTGITSSLSNVKARYSTTIILKLFHNFIVSWISASISSELPKWLNKIQKKYKFKNKIIPSV